ESHAPIKKNPLSLKFSHLFQLQHILSQLGSLSEGWMLEENSFVSSTPKGKVTFTNVLAVLDPLDPRRLLLACHHDSKILPAGPKNPKQVFVGASDSAIPCAMILEMATAQNSALQSTANTSEWQKTDSLGGSRHLAELMARTPHPSGSSETTLLQAVDLLVLLDLLGDPEPLIFNHFNNTSESLSVSLPEKRLHKQGLLTSYPSEQSYFRKDFYGGFMQDDHITFLHRVVPVHHLIPTPFPVFWHTLDDTEERIHRPTVENLTRIILSTNLKSANTTA
uniref:glutaminyl-peptide cyclotransferase n=1 Tax=Cyprinus carpio carpio TaxID=630221 RepID=A0A8C1H213_CYPCA